MQFNGLVGVNLSIGVDRSIIHRIVDCNPNIVFFLKEGKI